MMANNKISKSVGSVCDTNLSRSYTKLVNRSELNFYFWVLKIEVKVVLKRALQLMSEKLFFKTF